MWQQIRSLTNLVRSLLYGESRRSVSQLYYAGIPPEPPTNRVLDVVFIHGLQGDWQKTWCHSSDTHDYWHTWLAQEMPEIGIWSFGYEAAISRWTGSAMSILPRSVNTLAQLSLKLGTKPIVFIVHSMGGILVKQMLQDATELQINFGEALLQNTKGIVFLSTPHSGSDVAAWVKHFWVIRPTMLHRELSANDPQLLRLNTWFRTNYERLSLKAEVYYETQPTNGFMVVDAASADPGIQGITPIPVGANHQTICKPTSREDLVYASTRRFLQGVIQTLTPQTPSPRTEGIAQKTASLPKDTNKGQNIPSDRRAKCWAKIKNMTTDEFNTLEIDLQIPNGAMPHQYSSLSDRKHALAKWLDESDSWGRFPDTEN